MFTDQMTQGQTIAGYTGWREQEQQTDAKFM